SVAHGCRRWLWLTGSRNNATYSASVVDIVVQSCFLDIQLMILSLRNYILTEVPLRVSRQPACLPSEKMKSFVTEARGQSYHNLTPFVIEDRENVSAARADNVLLCLIRVSITQGKVYGTVEAPATPTLPQSTRPITYEDLTKAEKIREAYEIRATNISEWRKFVTDVKLAKDMHTTKFDQLYAYLRQHEAHVNEVHLIRQRFPDPLALVAKTYNSPPGYNTQSQYHQQLSPTDDLDAFDSDCNDAPLGSAILMAKLSAYDLDILLEVVQYTTSFEQQDAMIMFVIEEMSNQVAKCNEVNKHLVKHFVPQKQLFVEQAFWLPISKPVSEKPLVQPEPIPKDIPHELPSISVVKDSFNKMRTHVDNFDKVITVRTKVTGQTDGLAKEINEMKDVFNQMETKVNQCSVEKKYFEIEKKEIFIENYRLLEHIIFQDVMCTAMHAEFEPNCVLLANDNTLEYAEMEQSYIDEYSKCLKLEAELSKTKDMVEKAVYNELSNKCSRLEKCCISHEIKVQQNQESFHNDIPRKNQDAPDFLEFFEINDLKAQLQKKITTINNLKDRITTLKGKSMSDCIVFVNNSRMIAPVMYKLDLEPLSPKHRKNREVHVDYLKQTKEHADTLCDIVEQARALQPLDSALDYACKFTTRIQELLVYVSATCPSSINKSEKLVDITLMNKSMKVKFADPRVKSSTSASGSEPLDNTKKNRITQTSSSNQKNKVEDHLRSVKSSLNKKNHVSECIASTKHVVFDANSKLVCSTCLSRGIKRKIGNLRLSPSVVSRAFAAAAPIPTDTTGTPSSTTIDQDAPSASTSPTTYETQSLVIHPVKPKNYKEVLKESSWIEALQEEIHEFEHLQIWELVP
ncbi:hypothetical protein Tco_0281979, partial [Tanacetum coccineum]